MCRLKLSDWVPRLATTQANSDVPINGDDFFAQEDLRIYFPAGPDITFLDGMHRAEYLLRDFINTERSAQQRTLVLLHNFLPLNSRMAERKPRPGDDNEGAYRNAWTGDVWRMLFALQSRRSNLHVRFLNCPPTGLVAVSNLNPSSTTLRDGYLAAVHELTNLELDPEQMAALRGMHPFLNTAALAVAPQDLTAVLCCR